MRYLFRRGQCFFVVTPKIFHITPHVKIVLTNAYPVNNIIKNVNRKIKFPCIVKPNNLGSSVGVGVANNEEELKSCIDVALSFDKEVLVEKFLSAAREFNIAVSKYEKIETSCIEEVVSKGDVYNFNDKYTNKTIKRKVPAEINEVVKQKIEEYAVLAYRKLKCSGIVRVDFLMFENEIYFNELNTIPGSLSCYLWKKPKISYKTLLTKLIETSVKRFKEEEKCCHVFNSKVLDGLTDDDFKMTK